MWKDYPESPQPSQVNGTRDMGLGMALGRLQATLDHQTPILVQIAAGIQKMSTQLEKSSPTSAPAAPTTSSTPKVSDFTELLKAALPVIIVLGAIFKRINLPDWQGLIKSLTH